MFLLSLLLLMPTTQHATTGPVRCHPVVCVQHRYTMLNRSTVQVERRTQPTNTRNAYTVAPWSPWHITRTYRLEG